ncbi:hypothetical protein FRUB_08786 [Fimbriiglobus ruber]|uniref:DUF5117 domain-containing protein n=1 Tax=Fimbriiglobus ruber TaxID=1908690 RepID=A0A225D5I4_9BACT|nr:hypothetical protein FRUB_08786 [Fimbriiglobus ruber]
MTATLFAIGLAVLPGRGPASDPPEDVSDDIIPKAAAKAAAKLTATDPDDPTKKFPDFAGVVKGAKVHEGLITLYQKDEHVYAELRPDQFDRPFLMPIAIAKGGGAMGGETRNFDEQWVILFKRVGDKVFLSRRNVRYTAKVGSAAARAVETAYTDSVLMALPIKTLNPAKSSVLIDLNQIFFTDFAEIGLGSIDSSRTTWGKIKAFKKNVELQVTATFSGGGFGRFFMMFGGDDGIIDHRGITLVLQYGLIELPDSSYSPRYADDRVGHFLTAVKDFSRDNPETAYVRMINRWRLERADGSTWKEGGKLVPPKKRIVFWIENSVPDEYREAVREGILEWNKAFEKIGFKNAIEVRQQEGEDFDPEDVTYSTFRWTAHDGGFAIGPSRANPLTGEILDADILFDGSFVRYYKQEQRLYRDDAGRPVVPASSIQASHRGWELPVHPLAFRNSPFGWNDAPKAGAPLLTPEMRAWQRTHVARAGYCQCGAHKRDELALAIAVLAAGVGLKEGEKIPDELLYQGVKETTMHEVGHTLGLRHNFKASTMLPNDKLHDIAVTRKNGLVGSVMDYNPANIAPKGTKQGDYFTNTIGPYDYWAIEYAYKPLSGGSDGEAAELKKIAAKVADPALTYGTDEDVFGTSDPQINRFDLGADPIQFGRDRIKLAQALLTSLSEKGADKGEGYQRVRQGFSLALGQYGNAAYLASRYVGGVSSHRDHKGDANGRDPLVPIPADKQREALKFLQETVLTDKPFNFSPELLRKLGSDRWYHWGNEYSLYAGVDFPVNERVLRIQQIALNELLDGDVLSRIQNSARSAAKEEKPLTVAEVFRALSDGIFADLPTADGKAAAGVSSIVSRNLHRAYLQRLSEMVLGPKNNFGGGFFIIMGRGMGGSEIPADARSLARFHLREAGKRIDAALKDEKDDTVRAHLEEAKERIAKVLTANVTANEP